MSLVSIILPSYNHGAFLKQRVESILQQSFQNFELIILDDCSTDNSREVIDQFRGHSKVSHVVYNEKNSGSVFKQWDRGIQLSQGEFIWIAESDDYADLHFLDRMIPVLAKNLNIGFAYCNSYIVDSQGNASGKTFSEIRNGAFATNKWQDSYILNGQQEIKENLLANCTVNNASSVLFRKEALIQVKPFDRNFRFIGDWYCYIKICNRYDIAYLHLPLNYYRDHAVNASKGLKSNMNFLSEYFNLYDWAINNITFIEESAIKNNFKKYMRHSLSGNWKLRISHYKKFYSLNKDLFWIMIRCNAIYPIQEQASKLKATIKRLVVS